MGYGVEAGRWYLLDTTSGQVASSENEQPGYTYMPVGGVFVSDLNGANAKACMQKGDIITEVNGLRVNNIQLLLTAVNLHHPGELVTLTVYRGGSEIEVEIRLTEG